MDYYEVLPASKAFQGDKSLTYRSKYNFDVGSIVTIKLRNNSALGIIISKVSKPSFPTVEIDSKLSIVKLTTAQLALLKWMLEFYPGSIGSCANLFAPAFLNKPKPAVSKTKKINNSSFETNILPTLTEEQMKAYSSITNNRNGPEGSYLVHGETGSGKTRLYIELAKDSFKQGKSSLILTPEISLTASLSKEFKKVFGDAVLINHSSLTQKQKQGLYYQVYKNKNPIILIGPRSTLFLPLEDIGLVVVDEFHESAYKQESRPYYHANRAASVLARLTKSKLIFGSATPSINDYFLAKQKKVPIIRMQHQAIKTSFEATKKIVVNLLDKDEASPYPLLSNTLLKNITNNLAGGGQTLLFINKRGSARSITCQDCSWRATCKFCDLPLVYHHDQHKLRCHTCGYTKNPPSNCPECASIEIFFSSPGTKEVVKSLNKLFPKALLARYDKDNKKDERIENSYDDILSGRVNIIVGTQLIAKGHDLPKLSLVGMLLADSSLDFPDFTAEEKTFQQIKQLLGRVGRGHKQGTAIIQTFKPQADHIKFIQEDGDWHEFYNSQIKQRKILKLPPYWNVLKVETSKKTRLASEQSLEKLKQTILEKFRDIEILGPAPSFIEKKAGKWHWQIIIKSKERKQLTEIMRYIPSSYKTNIDPLNLL